MSSDPVGSTNILVVEDEMVLRMRAVDIVEDAGFTAVQAVNADEALSILESRSDISLLFSDIQMPGSMDGLKLAHAVHDRWPSIKIHSGIRPGRIIRYGQATGQPLLREAAGGEGDDCPAAGYGGDRRAEDRSNGNYPARG
jgi:hypothetical protein